MSESRIVLHQISASPNSFKVRVALGYKGLAYESREIDFSTGFPGDRAQVIGLTRQPRTPVLEHGAVRLFDSSSILRYLEANFPDTPPLFTTDYIEFSKLEEWEAWGRKSELTAAIGAVFGQAQSPEPDRELIAQANLEFQEASGRLEEQLAQTPFLLADRMTAADIVCASVARLGTLQADDVGGPITAFFAEHLELGAQREKTRAWIEAIAAHDH